MNFLMNKMNLTNIIERLEKLEKFQILQEFNILFHKKHKNSYLSREKFDRLYLKTLDRYIRFNYEMGQMATGTYRV